MFDSQHETEEVVEIVDEDLGTEDPFAADGDDGPEVFADDTEIDGLPDLSGEPL